jgi:hypothetical protein
MAGAGRSIHSDKDVFAIIQPLAVTSGEMQAPGSHIAFYQFFEAGFIDGQNALLETLDLLWNNVNTGDVITQVCETGTCYETYIACADDTYS